MDFQIYDCTDNNQVMVNEGSPNSKNSWHLPSDGSMDNEEYFSWPNALKIDESKFDNSDVSKNGRKRKLNDDTLEVELTKITKANGYKILKNVGNREESTKQNSGVGKKIQTGTSRMPQWQVDDISDLNADIEGSLHGLGSELSNNSYNMSDAILSISGLTVFKQEAPSPTSHEVGAVQIVRQNHNPPTTTQGTVITASSTINDGNAVLNTTLHQLLGQTGYSNLQSAIDGNLLSTSPSLSQDGYGVVSSATSTFTEDSRFQYVLAAATSIATKVNEDTLTYLNQGQSYEIKLKKLGDLSTYRGRFLKSVIRICFHERRLQYMEKEQMSLWQRARPGDRILEVDVPLSYGLHDVVQQSNALNIAQFSWDPTKEVGVYIKVNCISTEFTPKKHGGEKGVPFRIQVETYQAGEGNDGPKRLHAAACQIKVFKLKGADRKHKQDREKILKRPRSEQEKYQPSYDCTVLNDISNDAVVPSPPVGSFSCESGSQNNLNNLQDQLTPKDENSTHIPAPSPTVTSSVVPETDQRKQLTCVDALLAEFDPQQTTRWLTNNRFDKFLQTFSSFSGADMLRMSREDLIQICGHADGIRLYNALHSKTIAPKLTIYVCRENTTVFNAIFLSTHNNVELLHKLSSLMGLRKEQVKDVYMQGPQSIHIQLNNDVIRHIKEETMFSLEILQDSGSYIFVLKPAVK